MKQIPSDTAWAQRPVAAGPYYPWLCDRGSLTQRIADRCPGVRVELVFQGARRPDRDERFLFPDGGRPAVLVREVYLYCGDTPVVYAHTVLDPEELRGTWRALTRLGTRPLGAALFADPRVKRYPLRHRKLAPHHELHARARARLDYVPATLWARRSLFALHNSPILVTEVFLPGILKL